MPKMMSLKKDMNDDNALRWGRFKNMGTTVADEYYQPSPFFFTREKWPVQLVGHFRGRSAFLIASGPSFKNVDQSLLRRPGVWTMTLNNAVRSFRGDAACIVDDPSRFVMSLWLDPKIMKFVPAAHFEKPMWDNRTLVHKDGTKEERWQPMEGIKVGDCPNVFGYHRNEKFMPHRFLYEDTINWGNHADNGGGRSVMLAAIRILFLLGFRNVYLVGVDLDMDKDKRYHFDEERSNSAVKGNCSTYTKMMGWFEQLQPIFLAENFIVKNCNFDSKLTAFPFISLEDAVYEATFEIGDVENERSNGMYTKYEDKEKAWKDQIKPITEQDITTIMPPLKTVPQPIPNIIRTPEARTNPLRPTSPIGATTSRAAVVDLEMPVPKKPAEPIIELLPPLPTPNRVEQMIKEAVTHTPITPSKPKSEDVKTPSRLENIGMPPAELLKRLEELRAKAKM